jgi:integrase/ribosomal protein L40E
MKKEETIAVMLRGQRRRSDLTDITLTDAQQETLEKYHRHLKGQGRALRTRIAYLSTMIRFAEYLGGRGYDEVGREDFARFIYDLRERGVKPTTITHDYQGLYKFYGWLGSFEKEDEDIYLKVLRKERYRPPRGERHVVKVEELPTQEEVKKILSYAVNNRDRAAIAMMYDLGTRPHELLNLNIGDVVFDEHGALITVGEHGKTGARTLRPIFALPYLREWLESHPRKGQKGAPLFISMAQNFGDRFSETSLRRSIQKAAKYAGIEKRLYSYLFRHTAITREASNGLGDQELKTFFGWTQDSQMLRVYSHLTSEDVNRKRLEQAGIITPREKKHELSFQTCPRCGAENPATHEYCNRCASPLDETRYRELVSREQEIATLRQEIERLRGRDVEQLKAEIQQAVPDLVEAMARQILAKRMQAQGNATAT